LSKVNLWDRAAEAKRLIREVALDTCDILDVLQDDLSITSSTEVLAGFKVTVIVEDLGEGN
tara:strand:+ start:562 stop:744 length:183 start_codon:yes stop_codon:yes gene_type:complete